MFTEAIAKVHGPQYPEIIEVREIYETIDEKCSNDKNTNLTEEFAKIRELTNGYVVPQDTCETTEASYRLLQKADQLYQAS